MKDAEEDLIEFLVGEPHCLRCGGEVDHSNYEYQEDRCKCCSEVASRAGLYKALVESRNKVVGLELRIKQLEFDVADAHDILELERAEFASVDETEKDAK